MAKNRIFYQDYLMDFEKDSNDYPVVSLKYIDNIDDCLDINYEYNLFDIQNSLIKRTISFQKLHDMLKKEVWNKLLNKVKNLDLVVIVDDIIIDNTEVCEMKDFYLKVYYWNLFQVNQNTYIYKTY